MSIPFFANLAFVIAAYLLTYAAGSVLMALFAAPERTRLYEFKRLAFGVWSLIAGYSIWHTGGHTLSLGLLFLALYALGYYRPSLHWRLQFNFPALLLQLGILLLIFTLLYFQVYGPLTQTLRYYPIDLTAQATLVEKLNATGLESTLADFYFHEPVRNLYHYGDLWYPALFTQLFGMRAMEGVYFVYTAIAATIVTTGALAFAEQLRGEQQLQRTEILLALGFIGLSGLSLYVPKSGWLDARWAEYFTLISLPKVYWMAMGMLYATIALHRNDLMGAVLSVLTICFLYFVAAPAILLGVLFVLGFELAMRKLTWPAAMRLFIPMMVLILFLLGYAVYYHEDLPGNQDSLTAGIEHFLSDDKKYIKDVIYTLVYTGVRVLIASLPFLVLIGYGRRRLFASVADTRVLFFLFGGLLGGILAYGVLYVQVDAFQLWTVPHSGLIALLVFLLLLQVPLPAWLKLAVLGLCWYQNVVAYRDKQFAFRPYAYDAAFVKTLTTKAGASEGADFAVIRKPVRKAEDPLWGSDPNQYFPYDLLKWTWRAYHPYNISLLDTELQDDPAWAEFQRAYIRNSTFGRYVTKYRADRIFTSVEACQLDFIREVQIRFLLIEAGANVPASLEALVAENFTDRQTGYRFCVLREN